LEGGNKASNETCAKANGRAEYIPAALSRYETNLSTETTGCTADALVIPINRTAAYMDPIALNNSCTFSLEEKY
jgi:hypothetical protein